MMKAGRDVWDIEKDIGKILARFGAADSSVLTSSNHHSTRADIDDKLSRRRRNGETDDDRSTPEPVTIVVTSQTLNGGTATGCNADAACGCHGGVPVFDGLEPRYKRVLWTVIGINGAMFVTEIVAGQLAGSQALKADALDFLADTVTYGLSLAVIGASVKTRATGALLGAMSGHRLPTWQSITSLFGNAHRARYQGTHCSLQSRRYASILAP
jgi:Cation efflux family